MKLAVLIAFVGVAVGLAGTPSSAAPPSLAAESLKDLLANTIRGVSFDLCFPADSEEYEALGKNGIIKFESYSAIGTELPLKAAYVLAKGVRVPLHRIAVFDKTQDSVDSTNRYTRQVSFYVLPLSFLKMDARVMVDFAGARTGFGVARYSSKDKMDGPAFVRLDEYDDASDPDPDAVAALLVREYPDYFPRRDVAGPAS